MVESRKRISDLISHLEHYKEVEIVPIAKEFTIVVNGQGVYASDSRTFEQSPGHYSYVLGFRDTRMPPGQRVSPQAFALSTAIEIGPLKDTTVIKLVARNTASIDGKEYANVKRERIVLKTQLQSATSHPHWPVIKQMRCEYFSVSVYQHKKVFYLCEARLHKEAEDEIRFDTLDQTIHWRHLEPIDALTEHLAKRAKRLSYYTDGDIPPIDA